MSYLSPSNFPIKLCAENDGALAVGGADLILELLVELVVELDELPSW